ncbi:MAG: hypothetical protein J0I07_39405, partial [Myxococcales bacterium]|nr:hypothetical protein [Myxococcales bacterium]
PFSVAVGSTGHLYITETYSGARVRKVDAVTGLISTVAGTGTAGFSGDGGAATAAQLRTPWGVAVDGVGHAYIADTDNNRVRKIDAAAATIIQHRRGRPIAIDDEAATHGGGRSSSRGGWPRAGARAGRGASCTARDRESPFVSLAHPRRRSAGVHGDRRRVRRCLQLSLVHRALRRRPCSRPRSRSIERRAGGPRGRALGRCAEPPFGGSLRLALGGHRSLCARRSQPHAARRALAHGRACCSASASIFWHSRNRNAGARDPTRDRYRFGRYHGGSVKKNRLSYEIGKKADVSGDSSHACAGAAARRRSDTRHVGA